MKIPLDKVKKVGEAVYHRYLLAIDGVTYWTTGLTTNGMSCSFCEQFPGTTNQMVSRDSLVELYICGDCLREMTK